MLTTLSAVKGMKPFKMSMQTMENINRSRLNTQLSKCVHIHKLKLKLLHKYNGGN